MKYFKNLLIAAIYLMVFSCYAQYPYLTNLQKYWKYRERLKNFVVVGDPYLCQGCSSPANKKSSEFISWNDATDHFGYYIGMLATEYYLLKNSGNIQRLQDTKKELFYALSKFNVLDCWAEPYWSLYYDNHTVDYPFECSPLNGFFIRDDIPSNFGDILCQGPSDSDYDLIENYLTSSFVPEPDGYLLKNYNDCAYHYGIYTYNRGPVEESLDHVIRMMIGWALVSKFVDPNDFYQEGSTQKYFADGTKYFVFEAKKQCRRAIDLMANNPYMKWCISNPTYPNHCTFGVSNHCACVLGAENGAYAKELQFGFSRAECAISNSFAGTCTYFDYYDGNKWQWEHIYINGGNNDQYQKIFELAAIGGLYNPGAIAGNCYCGNMTKCSDREHIPLLYDALWGTNSRNQGVFSDAFYECLLSAAPCRGINFHFPNVEWSRGGDRILNGNKKEFLPDVQENYGVDYMLYFNLYSILNWNSFSSYYQYIRPQDLCPSDLIKQHWLEAGKKNFLAANTITAGNVPPNTAIDDYDYLTNTFQDFYWIKNDNNPNQPDPYRRAQVTFTAGHYIDLMPGFLADYGVLFNAEIDNTLKKMDCSDDPYFQYNYCFVNEDKSMTMHGMLTESSTCGNSSIIADTIYLVDTNNRIVFGITPAITDSFGLFGFYDRELKALDSKALFGFKSGKGYVIEDTTLRTIPEWFALSPLQLNITDIPKPEWTRQYFGASDPLNLVAKTIDINENIHILGAQYYNISNTDLLLLKYNSDGDLQWVRTYASPGNISDNPVNLCTDSLCNIYIIGNKGVYSYNVDFLVLKYDSSGTQQWMRQYNAGKSPTSQDYVTDLVTDNHGNLYVSGYSIEQNALVNLVTIKYNALGRQQWVRTFFSGDYSQNPGIYNADLSVDNLGNTYLASSCIDVPGNNTKYLIIKRNPAGDVLWTVKKDINSSGPDNATGMALDKAGNIFVTGNSGTVKYDNDGNFIWHQPGNFNKILVDNSDNIYVGNIGPADFLKKYDNITGNVLWSLNENPVYDFIVDRNNNIYFGSTDNCWKADSAGNIVASITFPYQAVSACISPNLNLYVAGYEPQNDSNYASYSIFICPNILNALRWRL